MIRIAGRKLFFFYAWQHRPGLEQLPGAGPTDFSPWLAALADVDYRGPVNAFMHGDEPPAVMAEALLKSRTYLEQCYPKANSK